MRNIHIALVHYPVVRNGAVITSSVTNLDIHDISRLSRTYGLGGYFIVQPDPGQRRIAETLISHWTTGRGARSNPDRREALYATRITESIAEVRDSILADIGSQPIIAVTTARKNKNSVPPDDPLLTGKMPVLLLFGTAGGLSPEIIENADVVVDPVDPGTGYNHLSVRSAVSIFVDRLFLIRNMGNRIF